MIGWCFFQGFAGYLCMYIGNLSRGVCICFWNQCESIYISHILTGITSYMSVSSHKTHSLLANVSSEANQFLWWMICFDSIVFWCWHGARQDWFNIGSIFNVPYYYIMQALIHVKDVSHVFSCFNGFSWITPFKHPQILLRCQDACRYGSCPAKVAGASNSWTTSRTRLCLKGAERSTNGQTLICQVWESHQKTDPTKIQRK